MIKTVHIFDVDGVLVDSSHRYRVIDGRIDLSHWRKNSTREKIAQDKLLPLASYYRSLVCDETSYVVIATARECWEPDFRFVAEVLTWPQRFYYRSCGDTTKGAILKIRATRWIKNLNPFRKAQVHIYEDNKTYLQALTEYHKAIPHFIPSNQGY